MPDDEGEHRKALISSAKRRSGTTNGKTNDSRKGWSARSKPKGYALAIAPAILRREPPCSFVYLYAIKLLRLLCLLGCDFRALHSLVARKMLSQVNRNKTPWRAKWDGSGCLLMRTSWPYAKQRLNQHLPCTALLRGLQKI